MKISLNVVERMHALQYLNAFKGNIEQLSAVIDDVKVIRFTEEEMAEFEIRNNPILDEKGEPTGRENIVYTATKDREVELELNKRTVDYLSGALDEKNKKGEFTVADAPAISLFNKLK